MEFESEDALWRKGGRARRSLTSPFGADLATWVSSICLFVIAGVILGLLVA
jgi:hypothetical protein